MAVLIDLFATFFQIGLFSIGGGYAALPLIQNQVVDVHRWLSLEEMLDLIAISQMTPGPIAINTATFVGTRVAGIPGSLFATAGLVCPSIIIVLALSYLYFKYRSLKGVEGILRGIRPAVVSLIAVAALGIIAASFWHGSDGVLSLTADLLRRTDFIAVILFGACLFVLIRYKPNPVYVMLASGGVGFILYHFL
ncbi:MAG: chromate transporter [Saccharofermentanales bacterium]